MAAAGQARAAPSYQHVNTRTRKRIRPQSRPAPRRLLAGGIFWIVVAGLLLAGIVALNVAVLQLNVRLDRLGRERAKLRAENAALASELSSQATSPRIQALAHRQLGLVPAAPDETTYVELGRSAK